MPTPSRFRRACRELFPRFVSLACLTLALGGHAAEDEVRFSTTLTAVQRTEAGFGKLTEDHIAVIDALVRQDETALRRRSTALPKGNFSQRRTEHELLITGLSLLTVEQRTRLDDLVAQRSAASLPMLTAEMASPPRIRRMPEQPVTQRGLEIHGSVSLTYAWSKGGNVRGGEILVSAQDPSHRFNVTVGYSEYRGKGLSPYYDTTDDLYRYRPGANLSGADR